MYARCLGEKFAHTWSVWEMKIIKCAINQKLTIWEWWKWFRKMLRGHLSTFERSKVKAPFWPGIAPTWQLASAEKERPISMTLQNNQSSLFGWGHLPSWGNSGSEWGLHFWPYQCWKVTKEQLSRPFSPFSDRNFLIYGTFYYFHFPNTSSVGEFFAQTPRCPRLLL